MADVENALYIKCAEWTPDQFATVVSALLSNQHNAAPRRVLAAKLGDQGDQALLDMLRANLLGLRPGYSRWAQDLPEEAWDGAKSRKAQLITPASATHLYAMKLLQPPLEPQQVRPISCMRIASRIAKYARSCMLRPLLSR